MKEIVCDGDRKLERLILCTYKYNISICRSHLITSCFVLFQKLTNKTKVKQRILFKFQMVQAIQVLRFHLLELEKVSFNK